MRAIIVQRLGDSGRVIVLLGVDAAAAAGGGDDGGGHGLCGSGSDLFVLIVVVAASVGVSVRRSTNS